MSSSHPRGGRPITDDEFLAAFEACTLPRPLWTHEAHVRMAWLYLTRLPFADALERIRGGIRRYNTSLGNAAGYHDTITVAYARLVAARIAPGEDFANFRARHPELFDCTLSALKRHYSEARLQSPEAREQFIEPDLRELPRG